MMELPDKGSKINCNQAKQIERRCAFSKVPGQEAFKLTQLDILLGFYHGSSNFKETFN
jgi:hypothetical protein